MRINSPKSHCNIYSRDRESKVTEEDSIDFNDDTTSIRYSDAAAYDFWLWIYIVLVQRIHNSYLNNYITIIIYLWGLIVCCKFVKKTNETKQKKKQWAVFMLIGIQSTVFTLNESNK